MRFGLREGWWGRGGCREFLGLDLALGFVGSWVLRRDDDGSFWSGMDVENGHFSKYGLFVCLSVCL